VAEPLKNQFGIEIPRRIATMISGVFPTFDGFGFVRNAMDGYDRLELMPRARKIAQALRAYLPENYPEAIEILIASLGPKHANTSDFGMATFLYLPHVLFVADYGIDAFEPSMRAQYELTQRFSAEFSIRSFLERHTAATLARLRLWTADPNPHVRRLVSEGTRPRLPWARRLAQFQKDPRPVLDLLELLKDDPDLYVRRSVANNLNDIGKDHPSLLVETACRWLQNASEERRWLIGHALRSALKKGEPEALAIMGFGEPPRVALGRVELSPPRVLLGGAIKVGFELANTGSRPQRILVDFRIHFVKSDGRTRPKVFRLKTVELAPAEKAFMAKTVSLRQLTTRRHYAGTHRVDLLLNGQSVALGSFELLQSPASAAAGT
jgi:3-methyladenine DNA glycosylase AlkC